MHWPEKNLQPFPEKMFKMAASNTYIRGDLFEF
jgi:hypothetical protein